ncbi:XRE family transcriptional regulator [Paenibacillus anaericanus]|uniref:XRE family transcriptional regulator n=1 Tax=Paenibacillus anaericanus TaxID=170367 RepID=A0A3S1BZX5_9BACL|nr:XRE family transcriptional regulator [Paenibacillus anaericanus]
MNLSSRLTFEPFRIWWTINKGPKMDLTKETSFSPQTASKIWKDRFPVRSDVIETICSEYGLSIEQVIRYKKEGE